ncbi:hypothetical protein MHBO_003616 [Bonamia ostreae]|uniref:Uncharacterized protein n=1 Tax=Bonamia ostreae TaxID=126728 RepID=A0ABV2AR07_9EUKA
MIESLEDADLCKEYQLKQIRQTECVFSSNGKNFLLKNKNFRDKKRRKFETKSETGKTGPMRKKTKLEKQVEISSFLKAKSPQSKTKKIAKETDLIVID